MFSPSLLCAPLIVLTRRYMLVLCFTSRLRLCSGGGVRAARRGAAETWQRRAETSCLLNDNGAACCYAVTRCCGVCVSFSPPRRSCTDFLPLLFGRFTWHSCWTMATPTSIRAHLDIVTIRTAPLANSELDTDTACWLLLTQVWILKNFTMHHYRIVNTDIDEFP